MEVFRIARDIYAKSLQASGKAARWNKDNQSVIYTGQSRALSTLELTVHKSSLSTALNYEVMIISLSDDEKLYTRKYLKDMPKNWRKMSANAALQELGSKWYVSNQSLILQVPSVIVPQEFNFIINTNHPDYSAKTVSLIQNEGYFWDERLLA
jgi:RES domain-containing protein